MLHHKVIKNDTRNCTWSDTIWSSNE